MNKISGKGEGGERKSSRAVKVKPSKLTNSKELLQKSLDRMTERYQRKECLSGIPTGFHELNSITSGLQQSELIVIAGRPAMGKTSLALNIAMNAAGDYGVPTAIFSLVGPEKSITV